MTQRCRVVLHYSRGSEAYVTQLDAPMPGVGDCLAFDGDVWRVVDVRRSEADEVELICRLDEPQRR